MRGSSTIIDINRVFPSFSVFLVCKIHAYILNITFVLFVQHMKNMRLLSGVLVLVHFFLSVFFLSFSLFLRFILLQFVVIFSCCISNDVSWLINFNWGNFIGSGTQRVYRTPCSIASFIHTCKTFANFLASVRLYFFLQS